MNFASLYAPIDADMRAVDAAPGSPTMGSLFDFLGFFWAELAVAVSLIRVGMFYVRKHSG